MRLASLTFFHVPVPLRRRVTHASHSRTRNDALFVKAETAGGRVGWGEGLPRAYVTGETIDDCLAALPRLTDPPDFADAAAVVAYLHGPFLPACDRERDRPGFGNSVRCAVETAALRAFGVDPVPFLKPAPKPDARLRLRSVSDEVRYGVVLATAKPWKRRALALAYRGWGFRDAKVKLGTGDDGAAATQARRWFGPRVALRADANEAWEPGEVAGKCDLLAALNYESVEQPVPRGRERELPPGLALPVMWDESVCCPADAQRLHALDPTCRFNLRLSKNGGLLRTWDVLRWAAARGVPCQLGCMVGEAGVLSAAGRWLAGRAEFARLEGGYGRHLVAEPFTRRTGRSAAGASRRSRPATAIPPAPCGASGSRRRRCGRRRGGSPEGAPRGAGVLPMGSGLPRPAPPPTLPRPRPRRRPPP